MVRWWPPVAETSCETAQWGGLTFTTSRLQRAIKTIVPVWRQFHADADADSVPSTVTSPTYM